MHICRRVVDMALGMFLLVGLIDMSFISTEDERDLTWHTQYFESQG